MWVARLGSPTFILDMWKVSPQAKSLYDALRLKGVNAILEYFDGYKHVDIGIPDAYMYIEVDGENHIVDPDQIERDFLRDYYSDKEGIATLHISNESVAKYVDRIACAIAVVVDRRKMLIKNAVLPH